MTSRNWFKIGGGLRKGSDLGRCVDPRYAEHVADTKKRASDAIRGLTMFENWYKIFLDEMPDINTTRGIAEKAWHARDAEIADLKRQVVLAQAQVAVVDRGLHDLGDTSAQATLDAYVQEKVDRAVLEEFDLVVKERPINPSYWDMHHRRELEERLTANRAKISKEK